MSDPRRYLDDADAPADARSLLKSAADDGLDAARTAAVAKALGLAEPAPAPRGGNGKWAAAGAAFVAAGALTLFAMRAPEPPKPTPSASAVVAAAPIDVPAPEAKPDAISVAQLPEAPADAPPTPSAAPVRAAPISTSADDLPAQLRALEDVRRALADRRTADARAGLTSYDRTFPKKRLADEARVLDIDTLFAEGRSADAQAKARAFLIAAPDSPYAARVRSLVAEHGAAP